MEADKFGRMVLAVGSGGAQLAAFWMLMPGDVGEARADDGALALPTQVEVLAPVEPEPAALPVEEAVAEDGVAAHTIMADLLLLVAREPTQVGVEQEVPALLPKHAEALVRPLDISAEDDTEPDLIDLVLPTDAMGGY